ncbi:MAG: hypothetical protein MJZ72_05965 [Bacteroidales bacterium]|nr:hypothetical protein [Bacteroidales bacterium]
MVIQHDVGSQVLHQLDDADWECEKYRWENEVKRTFAKETDFLGELREGSFGKEGFEQQQKFVARENSDQGCQ